MITEIIGDLFATDPKTHVICHQANCFNTLGNGTASGVAALVGRLYPEAAKADAQTTSGDKNKLGSISVAKGKDGRMVINLYGQYEFGGERPTNYEAVAKGFEEVLQRLTKFYQTKSKNFKLTIPYGFGSNRGGGSWRIVSRIIEVIFEKAPFDVVIIRLPNQPDLP